MRTTINIDDDVLEDLKSYAHNRSVALGKAATDLLRKGLKAPAPTKIVNGIVVFDLPLDSPRITTELVKELESEME
jgi:negative regulator of replication initiation